MAQSSPNTRGSAEPAAGPFAPPFPGTSSVPSRNRRAVALAASALTLLAARATWAEPSAAQASAPRATAHLTYERAPGAESCIEEGELRARVADRLGHDPFVAASTTAIEVRVAREDGKWLAQLTAEKDGRPAGARALSSDASRCDDLAETLALTLSVLLDPHGPLADATPREAPPVRSTKRADDPFFEPPAPATKEVAPPAPPAPRVVPFGAVGTSVLFAVAPAPSAGLFAQLGARHRDASLAVEGMVALPSSDPDARGPGARVSLTTASLLPCYALSVFETCAVGRVGALHAEGVGVSVPRSASTLYVAAGLRVGAALPLTRALAIAAFAEGAAPLSRTTLVLNDRDAWTTPALAAALGLAVRVRVP